MRCLTSGIVAALLALPGPAGAAEAIEKGMLLAVSPNVTGFGFARSIVLLVHHDEQGSLGIIINRPTRLDPAETFAGLDALEEYEGRVFIGGPLEPTQPLMLVNDTEDLLTDGEPVLGSVRIAASPDVLRPHASLLGDESTLRVYAGHVQWSPGQLQAEVDEGTWRVVEGSADAVFSDEPLELYRDIRRRDSELVADQDRPAEETSSRP